MDSSVSIRVYWSGLGFIGLVIFSCLLFYWFFPRDFPTNSWTPAVLVLITATLFSLWAGLTEKKAYWQFIGFIVILFLIFYYVVVWKDLEWHWQAGFGAFLFGALVGATEVGSRYRDEPLKTVMSPYGLIYVILNGAISLLALLLILHYKNIFPFVGDGSDKLKAAIVAGFGATLIMRSNLALIKTADNKEIPIGPDLVVRILLQIIDTNIDRLRAVERQRILQYNFQKIQELGSFEDAFPYLFNSLLAFQNLDNALKDQLNTTFNNYLKVKAPEDVKRLALGFVFLTLVGESNFEAIVRRAAEMKAGVPPPPLAPVSPPVTPTPPSGPL